jgi:thiamine biosynthesis lipoprotein
VTYFERFAVFGSLGVVGVADRDRLPAARATVGQVVEGFDRACSRFREDSELSALNALGGVAAPVSPLLLEAVQAGLRAAELTDGDVDPTIGGALIALGYDRDFDQIDPRRTPRIAAVPGWRAVELDRHNRTIRMPKGVTLDLGATAKALAADHAATAAQAAAGCGVLVGLGGDFAAAGPAPDGGWRIRVTDDHRSGPEAPGQWITISGGGLATSSTTVRRWSDAHHLIDPATGGPAREVWRTASVAAASCLDANIASTAAIVRGERAVEWLSSLGLPSRLVAADGRARHLAGWPVEGDELATEQAA